MAENQRLLNFVVVGDLRSGARVVQSSINRRGKVICHDDLFEEDDKLRQAAHEAYYGICEDPENCPTWFVDMVTNPVQYINHTVLDNPLRAEMAVGFRVLYPMVRKWELFELFAHRCLEGDFCVVHTVRNPVACFISHQQAQRTGIWWRKSGEVGERAIPPAVCPEVEELTDFCRQHIAMRNRLRTLCDDCFEVSYRDLFINYQEVMHNVFDFLEMPYTERPATPGCYRLRNRCISERISNFESLRKQVPADIAELMNAEDMF